MRLRGEVDPFVPRGADVIGIGEFGRRLRHRLLERLRRRRRRVAFGRQLLGETAVGIAEAKLGAVRQRRDADALAVDVGPIGAGEVVQDEKAALEDDLGVMPRHFRIAQDDVVAGIAAEREGAVGLQAVALLRAVQTDEKELGHRRSIVAELSRRAQGRASGR